MGSQIQLTVSLIFIALFSLAIFGFAIQFADDTEAEFSIIDDPDIQGFITEEQADLDLYKTDSEGTYASIIDTTVGVGSDVIRSTGPFTVSIKNVISIVKNIIFVPYRKIFGSGSGFTVFFTIFGSVIVFLFGLFVYKTLRGNPG